MGAPYTLPKGLKFSGPVEFEEELEWVVRLEYEGLATWLSTGPNWE